MRAHVRDRRKAAGDDLEAAISVELAGLDNAMVDEATYVAAARAGMEAVPGYSDRPIDPHALGQAHAAYRRPYAGNAVQRIAADLTDATNTIADDYADDLAGAYDAINTKLKATASDVTRYADPPWATGQAGYGNELGEFDVLMVWVLEEGADHCEDCPDLADESAQEPWSADEVPTWPGMGDTECLDRCKCHIEPDEESWNAAFEG